MHSSSTSTNQCNIDATSSIHSIRTTGIPMPLHPRMGRRMGMTASSSIVPLSGPSNTSASISSVSMIASTPLMSRTSSEASTSTTSSTSTTLTDDFRFEDEEDNQEELDDDTDDEDIYSSSDATSSRGAGHSSCPSASSLDSFTLPKDCFPSSSSSLASFSIASSSSSSSSKAKQTRIETPYTFPSPTPISELKASDLEASLRFSSSPNGSPASSEEDSAPPAFFPLQRVSFAPQLKIKTQGGVPLAMAGSNKSNQHGISGMMLGVTGTIEVLDVEKSRKTGR